MRLRETLPASAINKIEIKENNEPLVDIKEDAALFLSESLQAQPNVYLRQSVYARLKKAQALLPENYFLKICSAFRIFPAYCVYLRGISFAYAASVRHPHNRPDIKSDPFKIACAELDFIAACGFRRARRLCGRLQRACVAALNPFQARSCFPASAGSQWAARIRRQSVH